VHRLQVLPEEVRKKAAATSRRFQFMLDERLENRYDVGEKTDEKLKKSSVCVKKDFCWRTYFLHMSWI
jgi:hypothetical protein